MGWVRVRLWVALLIATVLEPSGMSSFIKWWHFGRVLCYLVVWYHCFGNMITCESHFWALLQILYYMLQQWLYFWVRHFWSILIKKHSGEISSMCHPHRSWFPRTDSDSIALWQISCVVPTFRMKLSTHHLGDYSSSRTTQIKCLYNYKSYILWICILLLPTGSLHFVVLHCAFITSRFAVFHQTSRVRRTLRDKPMAPSQVHVLLILLSAGILFWFELIATH